MRAQLQGDSIPTDMDVRMVISLLSQTGNPVDPEHRGSEIGKHFCSDQTSPFQRPALDIGGFFTVDRFHSRQTVQTSSSGSSFARRKFLAGFWEQRSNGVPIGSQQPLFQPSARVVPKTVHRWKIFYQPCLLGFAQVVGFVHRPY
jgi:hypothetical protein